MRFARRRDANERDIVAELRSRGASVQQLDGRGVPDLLVGYRGVNALIEVKQAHGLPGVGMKRTASGLRASQEAWREAWQGRKPFVVVAPHEVHDVLEVVMLEKVTW